MHASSHHHVLVIWKNVEITISVRTVAGFVATWKMTLEFQQADLMPIICMDFQFSLDVADAAAVFRFFLPFDFAAYQNCLDTNHLRLIRKSFACLRSHHFYLLHGRANNFKRHSLNFACHFSLQLWKSQANREVFEIFFALPECEILNCDRIDRVVKES